MLFCEVISHRQGQPSRLSSTELSLRCAPAPPGFLKDSPRGLFEMSRQREPNIRLPWHREPLLWFNLAADIRMWDNARSCVSATHCESALHSRPSD